MVLISTSHSIRSDCGCYGTKTGLSLYAARDSVAAPQPHLWYYTCNPEWHILERKHPHRPTDVQLSFANTYRSALPFKTSHFI